MIDTHEYIYLWVSIGRGVGPWPIRHACRGSRHRPRRVLMPRGDFDRSARNASTRARLLDAAARVYARDGVGGATLDQVAAEAGFTKGAVYSQFGSKENLLVALLQEHLAAQVAEQLAVFDRERITWARPLAGSAAWMEQLDRDPDPFRLFVELWVYAQRDDRVRDRLAVGLDALRATFERFSAISAEDAGIERLPHASENFATVVIALGIGMQMVRTIEPGRVPRSLLGAVLSVLVRAAEHESQARSAIADPDSVQERGAGTIPTTA
jgi:AcrR family transcriptional regulator